MGTDPTMSPVGKVTYEEYHRLVMDLVDEKLRSYVQQAWTKSIHEDPSRAAYPIRTTVNDIEGLARELKRAEQSHIFTGYLLPGCDVVKFTGGVTSIQGWRPNMLVIAEDGNQLSQPKVLNFTVWGQHVHLWEEKDLAPDKRRKVDLPLFRKVSVIAEEREFPLKAGGTGKGWTLLFFQQIHETIPISPVVLVDQLSKCSNAFELNQLNSSHLYGAVVVKGISWSHAQGIDDWMESHDKFSNVEVKGPDGKPLMRQDSATGRMEVVYDRVPKREKSPLGQPFMQDLIGSETMESPPTTMTMKLNIRPMGNQETDARPSIDFVNYRYGAPCLWIYGLDPILQSAVAKGNVYDPDPEKNPYAVLNNSYRGSELLAVVNFTKLSPYTSRQGKTLTYMTFLPGFVTFKNAGSLEANDVRIPPLPNEFGSVTPAPVVAQPETVPTQTLAPVQPVQPQPLDKLGLVVGGIMEHTGLGEADIRTRIRNKIEELSGFVNEMAAAHIIAKDLEVPNEKLRGEQTPEVKAALGPTSLEDELMALDYKGLQSTLNSYREKGYEVILNQSKLGLINQIMEIKTGKVMPAKVIMETHASEAKAQNTAPEKILNVQERKAKVAEAKSKLLAQQQSQVEATAEISTEEQEWEKRRQELEEILKDLIVDFPNSTFKNLWGKDNDMEIFPEWVTSHHQEVVDGVIKSLLEKL